jgi:hypothetical protein
LRRLFFAGALLAWLLIVSGCSDGYQSCSAPISERLASSVYRVEFSYYCGPRCAGHFAYQLRKQDGVWVFTSQKALWFS